MEYRLGTDVNIYDLGETLELTCPNCNEKVRFGVYSNIERRAAVKFPPVNITLVHFLVCPKCASIFTVDEQKGKNFAKGEKLSIGNFDLKTLKEFKGEKTADTEK